MDETYRRARNAIFDENSEPTRKFLAYKRFQKAYDEQVGLRDKARAAAMRSPVSRQLWPMTSRQHDDAVEAAMERWLILGFKTEMEGALAALRCHETGPDS